MLSEFNMRPRRRSRVTFLSAEIVLQDFCNSLGTLKDEATDELHTLHPLVTEARWLFGPEFDTPEALQFH